MFQILAKSKAFAWRDFRRLGDLQKHMNESLASMVQIVETTLHKEPYTKEEVCKILEVTEGELNEISLSEKSWHGKDVLKLMLIQTTYLHFIDSWTKHSYFCSH